MHHLTRIQKTTSAKAVFSADQLKVLRKIYNKATRKKLPNYLSVRRAVAAIAELGGHTRPSLPIGWLTLYREGIVKYSKLKQTGTPCALEALV